jgi:hypothetical protein
MRLWRGLTRDAWLATLDGTCCRVILDDTCAPRALASHSGGWAQVPVIGALLSGGARAEYKHLERSVMNFQSQEFVHLLERAVSVSAPQPACTPPEALTHGSLPPQTCQGPPPA